MTEANAVFLQIGQPSDVFFLFIPNKKKQCVQKKIKKLLATQKKIIIHKYCNTVARVSLLFEEHTHAHTHTHTFLSAKQKKYNQKKVHNFRLLQTIRTDSHVTRVVCFVVFSFFCCCCCFLGKGAGVAQFCLRIRSSVCVCVCVCAETGCFVLFCFVFVCLLLYYFFCLKGGGWFFVHKCFFCFQANVALYHPRTISRVLGVAVSLSWSRLDQSDFSQESLFD